MIEELPSGGGAAGETKIYEVYASPQNDDELSANIKVYNAVMNGENAIYRTYSEMGWLTATLAFSASSLVSLTFEVSQNASDGSGLTTTQISMALNSSGSPIVSPESPISIPSTSEVEKMIANVGGGGESGGVRIYDIPQAVINATPSAPYELSQSEIDDFIAQGDFSNTIVRFIITEALSAQMYAENIIWRNGMLTANFCLSQTVADGDKVVIISFAKYMVQIGVMQGQGMAALTKQVATINI